MWRLLILPMLVLSLLTGVAARAWRGRGVLAWAGISLALQVVLAVVAVTLSAGETAESEHETWVIALAVLAPIVGAGVAACALALLPRR